MSSGNQLIYPAPAAVARTVVDGFISRDAGKLAEYLAVSAMRQMEYALMCGALPGEAGFFYNIEVSAYLR